MIRSRHTSLVRSKQVDEKKIRTGKEAVAENPAWRNLMYIRTAVCGFLQQPLLDGWVRAPRIVYIDRRCVAGIVREKEIAQMTFFTASRRASLMSECS